MGHNYSQLYSEEFAARKRLEAENAELRKQLEVARSWNETFQLGAEAMRIELAAAQATIANLEQTARNATLHWNAVAEQLAVAQKDATRYRWLRHPGFASIGVVSDDLNPIEGEELDAAIDAAIEKENEQ